MSERDPVELDVENDDQALSIAQIADRSELSADLKPLPRERLHVGARLARWLVMLTAIVLLLISAFAWLTYPHANETRQLSAGCRASVELTCNLVEAQQQRVAAWFDDVKDLIQLLVVSLLIPLLATLIGYLFSGHNPREHGDEPLR